MLSWFETFIDVLVSFILIKFTCSFVATLCEMIWRAAEIASRAIWVNPEKHFTFERMMRLSSCCKIVIITKTNVSVVQGVVIASIARNKTSSGFNVLEIIEEISSISATRQPSKFETMSLSLFT